MAVLGKLGDRWTPSVSDMLGSGEHRISIPPPAHAGGASDDDAESRRPTIPVPAPDSGMVSRRQPEPSVSEFDVDDDAIIPLPESRRIQAPTDETRIELPDDEMVGLPRAEEAAMEEDELVGLPEDRTTYYPEIPPPPPDEAWVEQNFDEDTFEDADLDDLVIYPADHDRD